MNERIQTLLAKFKETESTHRGAHVLIGSDEIEKFAELTVRECMNVLDPGEHQLIARFQARQMLADHFGVK